MAYKKQTIEQKKHNYKQRCKMYLELNEKEENILIKEYIEAEKIKRKEIFDLISKATICHVSSINY